MPQNATPSRPYVVRPATVVEELSFPEAMTTVIEGKTITRLEWADPAIVCKLLCLPGEAQALLRICLPDGLWHDWIIGAGDMFGTDWVVV